MSTADATKPSNDSTSNKQKTMIMNTNYKSIFAALIVATSFASCKPEPICTDTFSVVAPAALSQPLSTTSDGQPFESYDEAQEYANFLSHTDSTAFVQVTTECN